MVNKEQLFKSLQKVLLYYQYFDYAPTPTEIQRYLDIKTERDILREGLNHFIKKKYVVTVKNRIAFSRKVIRDTIGRQYKAEKLLQKVKPLLKLFILIPTVRLLGISGSMSMNQSDKTGDIDIFIITHDRYLWTTRFIILAIKKILRLLPFSPSEKLCFNIFFSNSYLTLPKTKQNLYVGHEVLQLKIFFDKNETYKNLLKTNTWIKKYFPNVHIISDKKNRIFSMLKKEKNPAFIEKILRKTQIWWLKRTGYSYKEYLGQLWFLEEVWEEKIKSGGYRI